MARGIISVLIRLIGMNMNFMNFVNKIKKLFNILASLYPLWYRALRYGVAPSTEHNFFRNGHAFNTIVDIGANRGQFALLMRYCIPEANIISFEPLPTAAKVYKTIFSKDNAVVLNQVAIGPEMNETDMHVSAKDDSSSLLPISSIQGEIFPGTEEVGTVRITVAPLEAFISDSDIKGSALLKLDVQGFEMEALQGCESLLHRFSWIYCECSFVELYSGQRLASDVIKWINDKGFRICGVYNASYDHNGNAIQADFLFQREF